MKLSMLLRTGRGDCGRSFAMLSRLSLKFMRMARPLRKPRKGLVVVSTIRDERRKKPLSSSDRPIWLSSIRRISGRDDFELSGVCCKDGGRGVLCVSFVTLRFFGGRKGVSFVGMVVVLGVS